MREGGGKRSEKSLISLQIGRKGTKVSVAADLQGMWPTPSTKKDTLMLREKLKL